ncbi:HAD family hydrolase [Clostridium disporicum]|uniref:HAD family hydrolase n=1 Tax=Clostridium disporicum TaxID=84024 RepID=UPI0028FE9F5C|nr:HAD family phosphatase [Clostridium celatum]
MYKNIIFDLGNVVLDYNPIAYLKDKLNDEKSEKIALENIFKSEEWQMLDRGVITEEEAIERIVNRDINNKEIIEIAFKDWYVMLNPLKDTVDLINELKSNGYKLYYLSNFHSRAFEYVTKNNEVFKAFNGGVVSFKEKLLKPERDIYIKILNDYDLKAEECIFIDDVLENVQGANKEGIKGIHFKNIKELREELNTCGVLNTEE